MEKLFRLSGAVRHDPEIDAWLSQDPVELFSLARHWFGVLRNSGDDVQELIHDGCPVACIADAAFAYVNVFSSHINLGFFTGALLDDPHGLLEGSGKRMRHVKIRPGAELRSAALHELIRTAYLDVKRRIESAGADQ